MNWLQSIFYGIVSGFTEFLPVSSSAHQFFMRKIFGADQTDAVLDFLVKIAVLTAVFMALKRNIDPMINAGSVRSRRRSAAQLDYFFVRTAVIPLALSMLLFRYIFNMQDSYITVAVLCIINGLVLFVQGRTLQGNKNAGAMTSIDSIFTGVLYSLSVFAGVSGVAVTTSYCVVRGADRQKALTWAFLLSIPALALNVLLSLFEMFSSFSATTFINYLSCFISAGFAFITSYLSIIFMRFISVRTGFSGFSYYCWGMALFSFFLYLI